MNRSYCLLFLALSCTFVTHAEVTLSSLFSDHMVIQQGAVVPVWGKASPGEDIVVNFNGQLIAAVAGTDSTWMVQLSPMDYTTTSLQMEVKGKNTILVEDILIGEVWLCSGQSNMERQLGPRPPQPLIHNWEQERDEANYPMIREYYVPLSYSPQTVDDVNSRWVVCSPETVSDFSAVGYFMAKNLHKRLNVPVGIIFSAYGGTPAEDWTSLEALQANPELQNVINNYQEEILAGWPPEQQIAGLYNGMIYPLLPYAIKGVAWYQGEANNERTEQYPVVLETMINNWRTGFGQGDFPFLIVQIAPHKEMRPELREAQLIATQKIKNTALIVTTDCGDADDIHPPFKQPVGERLALAAAKLAYGQDIVYSGPLYHSCQVEGNKIKLSFTHTADGLVTDGKDLQGFTIAGADGRFIPAEATIADNEVIVSAKEIGHPVAVRYGWKNVPDGNLFNTAGLPASPFRTDRAEDRE